MKTDERRVLSFAPEAATWPGRAVRGRGRRAAPIHVSPTAVVQAILAGLLAATLTVTAADAQQEPYYPGPADAWETRRPAEVGMDSAALEEAVAWTRDPAHDGWGPDLRQDLMEFLAGEPQNDIIGPMKERGPVTGVVIKDGFIVREWGDPHRVDMTFSVTKSFLSTVAGLAWDRGLIRDIHDPVVEYAPDSLFAEERLQKITWDHLLRQTSEWRGTLWGKPDWVDRFDGEIRELGEPGSHWEYNDVRVNLLSYCLLELWRQPLPQVLKEQVMDPIGASNKWRWYGYENTWVTIDGLRMQSVSGGGHWGGGMWLTARDQARFGLLWLRNGRWEGEQLVSEDWIEMAKTPTDGNEHYGFMNWFVNTDGEGLEPAPASAFTHSGAGVNRIYVDPDHDLVVVLRWLDGEYYDGFIRRVLDAVVE